MDANKDLYVKRKNANGSIVITHHRVWDATKFMTSLTQAARKESEAKPKEAYTVSVSTEAEYKKSLKPH